MTAVADETASAPTKLGVAAQYALLAGPLLSMLDSSIVNVAVTPIAVQLHAGLATVGWTVSAYLLALGTGLAAVSSVARRFGIIAVYRASLMLFTLASLACAVAPTVGVLIGARVCQGLFGAPLVPLAMTVLLGGSARAISPVGGILLFAAPALGPSLGGALVAASDWRAIFLVNVPLGALAVLATLGIAHGHVPGPSAGASFDPVGMLLVAAGLTLLLYGAAQAGTHGWSTPATWVAVAVGAVVLASYPWWARRHSHPALDLTLARHRDSLLALLLCAAASVVTFAAVFLIPVFLQAVQGHSALAAGLAMLPQGVLTGLGTVIGQRVLTRVSVRTTVLVGFALLATASAALFTIQVHTSIPVTAAILAVRAASIGLVITPLLAVMVRPLNSQQLADANALFNIVQRIAGSFGVGALASWYASAAVHHGPLSALHWIALVLVFLAALAAAFSVLLPTFRNTRLGQVSSATVDGRGAEIQTHRYRPRILSRQARWQLH